MLRKLHNLHTASRRNFLLATGIALAADMCIPFSIPALAENEKGDDKIYDAVVFFDLPVNDITVQNLIYTIDKIISSHQIKDIYLIIKSVGGDVEAAAECYEYLRAIPKKLITVNGADVQSSAVLIYLAGKYRLTYSESYFMIHSTAYQNININDVRKEELENFSNSLDQSDNIMKDIFSDQTKIPRDIIDRISAKQIYISAIDAVKYKIAMSIGGPEFSKDHLAFYVTGDDKRYFTGF